jgi:hypothetical protein
MKINIKWPWITIARHDKIVGEIVDDYQKAIDEYNDTASRVMDNTNVLSQELKETHKALAEEASKFMLWCSRMASAKAQVKFCETNTHDHYYIVNVIPELEKPRGTLDKFMVSLYESVARTLPDRWELNDRLSFRKTFGGIDRLIKAPENIQVLTAYLQNELNLLLDTDRRMEVLLAADKAEKKVTGPDVRD